MGRSQATRSRALSGHRFVYLWSSTVSMESGPVNNPQSRPVRRMASIHLSKCLYKRCTNVLLPRCHCLLPCCHASLLTVRMQKDSSSLGKCSSAEVQQYSSAGKCGSVRQYSSAGKCDSAAVQRYSSAAVQKCREVQGCSSAAVRRCGSAAVWQCGGVAVCGSAAVQQCAAVCGSVWQCGSTAVCGRSTAVCGSVRQCREVRRCRGVRQCAGIYRRRQPAGCMASLSGPC